MQNKEVNITMDKDAKNLFIREGKLNDIPLPERVEITGVITSVNEFIKKRTSKFKEKLSHITFSFEKKQIKLVTNEKFSKNGYTIIGKLEPAEQLEQLEVFTGIGSPKIYDTKSLFQVLRFNKALFDSGADCNKLIESVAKLKIKVDAVFEEDQTTRGNKALVRRQEVKSDIPLEFDLLTPIFKGFENKKYKVIVCFDVRDNKEVDFWFESPELAELIQLETKALIEKEIKNIPEGFVIIEE